MMKVETTNLELLSFHVLQEKLFQIEVSWFDESPDEIGTKGAFTECLDFKSEEPATLQVTMPDDSA